MRQSENTRLFIQLQTLAAAQQEAAAQLLRGHGLTATQYNVLRILRGANAPLSCKEVGARMWTRDSDITRLLDRLEKRRWIARCRSSRDRRAVHVAITPAGLQLLAALDGPIELLHSKQFAPLSASERQVFAEYLGRLAES
jgi:DNA-binding MarR family transcriptional regulator